MGYPPLPAHEQIRRPRPLPKWWNKPFKKASYWEARKESGTLTQEQMDFKEMSLREVILYLLSHRGPMSREELLAASRKQEPSMTPNLRLLFKEGKITFDYFGRIRKWRLIEPGEIITKTLVFALSGALQQRVYDAMNLLSGDPDKWFTVYELSVAVSQKKDSRITAALESMHSMGFVQRKPYEKSEGRPHQRKTHPWVYRVILPGEGV